LRLNRNTKKNSFTLVELSLLHKNGLSSLSVTKIPQKDEWQHTQNKKWVTTHSKQKVSDNIKEMWVTTHSRNVSTIPQNSLQGE
jgi:hypothetical protein